MKKPDDKVQQLVSRLQQASGANLVSVVLYGSAASEEFHEQYSDVNLLVVLRQLGAKELAALAPVIRWWSHEEKLRPPMIMTHQELSESADVFAIELLDIRKTHRTLVGEDVVAAIHVPMNLHRVEVEHELRTTLLRLRHHLLLAPDNEQELRTVLAKSISSVLTLFRHALIAVGETPLDSKPQLLEQAARVFEFDVAPLHGVLELRSDGKQANVVELYHSYMNAIGHVAHGLDTKVPKRHLQKTS